MGKSSKQSRLKAANRLLQQGTQQYYKSQFQAALQSWQQALTLYRKIADHQGEVDSLNNMGNAFQALGEYYQAADQHQQSLLIALEIGDRLRAAKSIGGLGDAYLCLGQYQEAIEHYQQSLAINGGNRIGEAKLLSNLGLAYYYLEDYQKAIEFHRQSLLIARKIVDRKQQAISLANLGIVYEAIDKYQKAMDYQQQSLDIAREISDRQGEAQSLGNLGIIFYSLVQYEQAIKHHQQALAIFQEIGDRRGEAESWSNLGRTSRALKEYQLAIDYYQQSLNIAREIGNQLGVATVLVNAGNVYQSTGEYEQAIEHYQQSLVIMKEIGSRRGEAYSLAGIGNVYAYLERYDLAIDYYQQQLAIAQEIGDRRLEGGTLSNLGANFLTLGELPQAENTLRAAVKIWESLRTELSNDAHKISIFDIQTDAYHLLQKVLVVQDKTLEALEIAERGRARALVELLARQLAAKPLGLIQESCLQESIQLPTLNTIKLISQERDSTLIEYSVIEVDDLLLIWVIKPTGEIDFRTVDLKPLKQQNSSLSNLVTQARESLGVEETLRSATPKTTQKTPQLIRYINEFLRQLHQYLIEPIANLLPTDSNAPVIFIPQGALFLVPFSALQDATGKFLIEQHTILTAPSIQVLDLTRQQRQRVATSHELPLQSQDVLVVGNPTMPTIPLTEPPEQLTPLPGSEAEANVIASLLNTKPIIGEKATKVYIEKLLPKARLIHLATHGLLDDIKQLGVPGAIALAPSGKDNGFLTAGEIYEMKLNAELIVLSACHSGQGKITGDGVVGLSRCLFAAGVPSVIVSLWSVGDDSTQF
jgi:CHAT domain-containing protein